MILRDDLVFGEGPRWRDGRLWLSDMHARRVIALDRRGGIEEVCRVPGCPSGLGWVDDELVVVSMTDRRVLRGPELRTWATVPAPFHLNDLLVTDGRAYVGNFGFDLFGGESLRTTALHRVDPDGSVHVAAEGLAFPNGMVRVGDTLLVAETPACRVSAFTIGTDGSLGDRRVHSTLPGLPDGMCAEPGGALWVACPIGGTWEAQTQSRFVRVEDGRVTHTLLVEDGFHATAVAWGGGELYLLEARTADPARIRGPGNARVRVVRP